MSVTATRLVKISRTLTLKKSVTLEVPKGLSNEKIEEALSQEGAIFTLIDGLTDQYEADVNDDNFDVEDTLSPSEHEHFPETDSELFSALEDDGLFS